MQTVVPFACFLSMIRPPGVQFENSLLQIVPVDKSKCPFVKDHTDVAFQLYTRHNPTTYQELIINDDERLFASNIDWHANTVIYFHAFMEMPDEGSGLMVREAYILRGDTNVIMVDAQRLEAGPWYFTAAENTWYIGKFAAQFIDYLVSRGLDLSRTHLIGHSLGAQAAGVAGAAITSGKVARITGLDPALPLFHGLPLERRLDEGDAHFVDVIHTDAGIFGVNKPVGHADFYPNGGISPQPGCELEVVIPQQLLLNNCDRNAKPEGLYAFYLKPNPKSKASRSKLERRLQKLFSYIQFVKENDFGKRKRHKTGSMKVSADSEVEQNTQNMEAIKTEITTGKGDTYDFMITNTTNITILFEPDKSRTKDENVNVLKKTEHKLFNETYEYYQDKISKETVPKINKEVKSVKGSNIDKSHDMIEDQEMTDSIIRPHVLKPITYMKPNKQSSSATKTDKQDEFMKEFVSRESSEPLEEINHGGKKETTTIEPEKTELQAVNVKNPWFIHRTGATLSKISNQEVINKDGQKATTKTEHDKTELHSVKVTNPWYIHGIDALMYEIFNQETAIKSYTEDKSDRSNFPTTLDVESPSGSSDTSNHESNKKSHVVKRQKRFINFFKQSENAEQSNFLFKMLDFLIKNRKHALPVYTVMREINTLVKSANGELNHSTKERNNYIGAPPPTVTPLTYDLQIGNENKIVAFMKKLVGLKPKGDRLVISGK